ncbi:dissimilatory sulfite reductase (desulfoviridin) alpha/beta subunit [Desulfobaculum xiamenense]|uniref:Dissimilatory sulfite reductase (Desulfoviridin) alpha/beta subunit n=1 Tax=Desulfobaculum xiamenense TaxID=995050 RepID=A0A846QMX4_9BACT|nr:4Fe-4S binding protein [Desulfobaculum xiamenense]NJB67603.1 dissimilatory sulfite reductase (desulfoviridin) alpha/beta subunit [Desulfobaculum xiamenense]
MHTSSHTPDSPHSSHASGHGPCAGLRITVCRGAEHCPHCAVQAPHLADALREALDPAHIAARLAERLGETPKPHHTLRIAISHCPNGCSQPQIVDLGLIGAAVPALDADACSGCGACVETCRENALVIHDGRVTAIDRERCLSCGECATACPSDALTIERTGLRVLVGGKLGRHPRLGEQLPGIFDVQTIPRVATALIDTYLAHMARGERLGDTVTRLGIAPFAQAAHSAAVDAPCR